MTSAPGSGRVVVVDIGAVVVDGATVVDVGAVVVDGATVVEEDTVGGPG